MTSLILLLGLSGPVTTSSCEGDSLVQVKTKLEKLTTEAIERASAAVPKLTSKKSVKQLVLDHDDRLDACTNRALALPAELQWDPGALNTIFRAREALAFYYWTKAKVHEARGDEETAENLEDKAKAALRDAVALLPATDDLAYLDYSCGRWPLEAWRNTCSAEIAEIKEAPLVSVSIDCDPALCSLVVDGQRSANPSQPLRVGEHLLWVIPVDGSEPERHELVFSFAKPDLVIMEELGGEQRRLESKLDLDQSFASFHLASDIGANEPVDEGNQPVDPDPDPPPNPEPAAVDAPRAKPQTVRALTLSSAILGAGAVVAGSLLLNFYGNECINPGAHPLDGATACGGTLKYPRPTAAALLAAGGALFAGGLVGFGVHELRTADRRPAGAMVTATFHF